MPDLLTVLFFEVVDRVAVCPSGAGLLRYLNTRAILNVSASNEVVLQENS